ncbi:hypothetical protein FA10DRAFT_61134 [Acaromyces ingoldii]|uniref:Uncharacterized protein n=1 Tax=Acaromyces ingoldii TaxID=215250 RepID=A0A316YR75_9BASI|nr:hypothetical protein FA10DRAFT_61134 [Acaromyces ingoldii]PWN91168.1 hypothetical protein FA10DRAFT_61134 [Acaromyces ingoldii]
MPARMRRFKSELERKRAHLLPLLLGLARSTEKKPLFAVRQEGRESHLLTAPCRAPRWRRCACQNLRAQPPVHCAHFAALNMHIYGSVCRAARPFCAFVPLSDEGLPAVRSGRRTCKCLAACSSSAGFSLFVVITLFDCYSASNAAFIARADGPAAPPP